MAKNTNNFIVQIVEHYNERGGDAGMATSIVGVADTLEEGMELLRVLGAKEGRVLQVFPPRVRARHLPLQGRQAGPKEVIATVQSSSTK